MTPKAALGIAPTGETNEFYLDFVEAENSSGFHAPQEALRILGQSIDFSRRGQLTLRPMRAGRGGR